MRARAIDAAYGRQELTRGDRFSRHALDDADLQALLDVLEQHGRIKKAWIARKLLKGDTSGVPHHVVLVAFSGIVFSEDKLLGELAEAIEMPGSFIVFTAGNQKTVASRVKNAAGGPVYGRR